MKKAIVLLSGGLDSITCLGLALKEGFEVYALTFKYHQKHNIEIDKAISIAKTYKVAKHLFAEFDLSIIGGSALTSDIAVPKNNLEQKTIPVTYVPARNTIFLSFALAWCEVLDCSDIFIGVNAVDFSGYPDCRPDYIKAYENMANFATRLGTEKGSRIKIHTPLLNLSKKEIILLGRTLGIDYSLTITCYDPDSNGNSCGECDSCLLRLKGFKEAGLTDAIPYKKNNR